MVFVKAEKEAQKNEPHFHIGVAIGLKVSRRSLVYISYSDQYYPSLGNKTKKML